MSNPYHIYCHFFDTAPPVKPTFTFTITPAPFAAHTCRNIGMPLFNYQVFADGKVVKGGGGKTEKHATTSAKRDIKLRAAAYDDAIKRWALSPGAFANHPIMVAAEAKRAAAEATEKEVAHDIWMRESGYYYWKPGTQFVPGMGEGHYD